MEQQKPDLSIVPPKPKDADDLLVLPSRALGYDFTDITGDDVSAGLWDAEIKAFMDTHTLKALFFHEDWVFILVDMLADHIAQSPLYVYRKRMQEGREYVDQVFAHPLNAFFEMPNEYQEYDSWMYNYVVENCLMGNTIQWRMKKSDQLLIFPTETVLLKFATSGKVDEYVVTTANGYAEDLVEDGMSFNPKDIWHHRRPNPASLVWGLSPFIANRKALLFNRYSQDYLNSFYLKGATPGLALKMEKNVAEDSAMRFLRSFEVAHTGRRNMRRTLMLPKGVDVKEITPTIGDQKLVEMINSNREKILNILRVPKHALSLAENGSLGSEEHKVALKFFYTSAIIPVQRKIAAFLTRMFRDERRLKDNEFLAFDNSGVEALKEDMMKRAQLGAALKEQWTLNEIRTLIHDMPPIEGGDEFPGATGLSTQPDVPNSGTHEPPEDAPDDVRKPDGEDSENTEEDEDDEDDSDKAIRAARTKIIEQKYGTVLALQAKALDATVDEHMGPTAEIWLAALLGMTAKALPLVERELERLPKREKAADDQPKKKPKRGKLKATLEETMAKDAEAVAAAQTEQLVGPMEGGYDAVLETVFDVPPTDEITALRARDADGRRTLLKARGMTTFAGVAESVTERILDVIEHGVANQRTIKEIIGDITANVAEIGKSRAATIARTEVLTAVSIGKVAAMRNARELIPDLMKVWITAGDERVRGAGKVRSKGNHFKLQGDVVPVDEPFENGLFYPRDVKSRKPHEVVNCRCDMLVVSARDLGDLNIPTN